MVVLLVNDELQGMDGNCNVLFEVLSWRLPERTDKNRDKLNKDSWWHPGRD